ncbi:hypothetical protein [Serratia symbiotica]|uniref:hypothetical protein n=1 Tax=Serratia symbiotica TaxID=138074 RepID=UPI001B37363E|nr:hypothetical protein [Serratia symbiotica]MBQ0956887.1 hypothetical protein [Serratia symbiotica]
MARTMRYFGHITPPAEKLMTDHPVQPESAEDEIIDIDTEAFAHTVAMMVLLKPGMSHTHSEPFSPPVPPDNLSRTSTV